MTVSAAKPEEKRLGWFVPTAVDQAESCVKPAAEGRTLARMPNPQHSETERLDHGPNWLKHTEDGLLLGECRLNVQDLTVQALLHENPAHVYHAAMLDPHTAAELDLDQIHALVDDLISAHGDWLPKWLTIRRAA